MNAKEFRRSRRLSFVPRWSVVPVIRQQMVDQHSYGVTPVVRVLLNRHAQGDDRIFRLDVIELCLDHDNIEAVTGDAPSPSKKPSYVPSSDTPQMVVIIKMADVMEAILYLEEEKMMGNKWVDGVMLELRSKAHDWWSLFDHKQGAKKPLTSDLIAEFVKSVTAQIHPAMESSYGV